MPKYVTNPVTQANSIKQGQALNKQLTDYIFQGQKQNQVNQNPQQNRQIMQLPSDQNKSNQNF